MSALWCSSIRALRVLSLFGDAGAFAPGAVARYYAAMTFLT